jgi:hypothetical protein
VTTGKAEPVTELTPPATLKTKPWTDDSMDGCKDVAELTLFRTLGRRLVPESTLGKPMLKIVFRLLVGLDKRPWTEVPLMKPIVEVELRLLRVLDMTA